MINLYPTMSNLQSDIVRIDKQTKTKIQISAVSKRQALNIK
jgi:hypothetical protein